MKNKRFFERAHDVITEEVLSMVPPSYFHAASQFGREEKCKVAVCKEEVGGRACQSGGANVLCNNLLLQQVTHSQET